MIKKLFAGVLVFVATAIGICFSSLSFSQTAPPIQWQNTIGGSDYDYLYSIQQTTDGGYILGGHSESGISGDKTEINYGSDDYWIVKTDSSGNIEWENTIGGSAGDVLHSIRQTADAGYILGGYSGSGISGDKTENSNGNFDYWIVKTDSSGNIGWQNTIGGSAADILYSIEQTADGGYILGGYSGSGISGDKTEINIGFSDYWIVKTDSSGNILWQNTIGGDSADVLHSIQQTADGGYILGGWSLSAISGDKTENCKGYYDYWLVKIDASGDIQWQNTIGGSGYDYLYSVQQTTDGGYILGGYSGSNISGDKTENAMGSYDFWIVKTDGSGAIQWQNTIGGNMDDVPFSIQQTVNGGYIIGGYSGSNISGDKTENSMGGADYWIVKTDATGTIQWQNTITGSNYDELYSIRQTADGGYILGGLSDSNLSGDKTENCIGGYDYWILKLAPDTVTSITQLPQLPNHQITISPNPATDKITVSFGETITGNVSIKIYNITGAVVLEKEIKSNASITNCQLPITNFTNGIYFLSVQTEKEKITKKVIVNH